MLAVHANKELMNLLFKNLLKRSGKNYGISEKPTNSMDIRKFSLSRSRSDPTGFELFLQSTTRFYNPHSPFVQSLQPTQQVGAPTNNKKEQNEKKNMENLLIKQNQQQIQQDALTFSTKFELGTFGFKDIPVFELSGLDNINHNYSIENKPTQKEEEEEVSNSIIQSIMKIQNISTREVSKTVNEEIVLLKQAFNIFDRNGDGEISSDELQDVIKALKLASEEELRVLCKQSKISNKSNKKAGIDFFDFIQLLRSVDKEKIDSFCQSFNFQSDELVCIQYLMNYSIFFVYF
jgi:Ca2+-binding EF-hand superfamily protein